MIPKPINLSLIPSAEAFALVQSHWRTGNPAPPPKRVIIADDRMQATRAFHLACEGTALLWRGDFQNGRLLLQAMARRVPAVKPVTAEELPQGFHRVRMTQAQQARTLGLLLIEVAADSSIALNRAPDVRAALQAAFGADHGSMVLSLRELQGLIGAFEWKKRGVPVPALGPAAMIHPHYGVFAPIRSEYLDLVSRAALPASGLSGGVPRLAFDIGTGTGVLAALVCERGVERVIATDTAPQALDCARDNIARLQLAHRVEVISADLFPPPSVGNADLIICNPPWLPGKPGSLLEQSVYDPESRMLRGFLQGLPQRLNAHGQGWLILSDLAERLKLRSREELQGWIDGAGLRVLRKTDIRPAHKRSKDDTDPLHIARAAEVTSLWALIGK